ncbi:MAG: hypothetical protein AMXMBFR47_34580 [Planctomycetota bacterium]
MIDIPTIDELREIRRRLAEQAGYDAHRYADLLRSGSNDESARIIDTPIAPRDEDSDRTSAA